MKDNFSALADSYAQYRPSFPDSFIEAICQLAPSKEQAVDLATGNGQVATVLAKYFKQVYATDVSEKQLGNAPKSANIKYASEPAETIGLPDKSVDLVIAAQAIHWFELPKFYAEVKRVLKPGGLFAAVGYNLLGSGNALDQVFHELHDDILKDYWDPERRMVINAYKNLPFPFNEIRLPKADMHYDWNLDDLLGYFSTWSAVKHYQDRHGENPVSFIVSDLRRHWPVNQDRIRIDFPVFGRIGTT